MMMKQKKIKKSKSRNKMNDINLLETTVKRLLDDTNKLILDLAIDEQVIQKNIDQKEKNILIGKAKAYDKILREINSIKCDSMD